MTTASSGAFIPGTVGFSGNTCVDLLRAFTVRSWSYYGHQNFVFTSCNGVDVLTGGTVVGTYVDKTTGVQSNINISVVANGLDTYQSIQGVPAFAGVNLTASEIGAVWTAGFGLVIVCFLIGRAVGAVLQFIRKG